MPNYEQCNAQSNTSSIVNTAAELASRQLGIAKPEVRFFRESRDGYVKKAYPIYGYAYAKTIFIRENLGYDQLIKTTAHECAHLAYPAGLESIDERRADLFAKEFWPHAENGRSFSTIIQELERRAKIQREEERMDFSIPEIRKLGDLALDIMEAQSDAALSPPEQRAGAQARLTNLREEYVQFLNGRKAPASYALTPEQQQRCRLVATRGRQLAGAMKDGRELAAFSNGGYERR